MKGGNEYAVKDPVVVVSVKVGSRYDEEETTTLPIKPSSSPAIAPAGNVSPEATAGGGNTTVKPEAAPPRNHSPKLNSLSYMLILMIIFPFFVIV
ncbi:hypothetical protein PanWU01x14_202260 [Parasponia andersonii]|uniref:Transmembrane protein n=1 Tax=Parasponia andersonii TaxID=3476 RepID=A0A2P5BXJ4_PARAD|nr:hypothetical protein PanWU01x14_202260 [Parasponia andersonii]